MSLLVLWLALSGSVDLDDGRMAFSAMRYRQAVEHLRVVAGDENAPPAERTEALGLLARAWLALGHEDDARRAWMELLALDPMAPEPAGAPKVRASFRAAKADTFPPRFLELARAPTGRDVLELQVVNPWALDVEVELWEVARGEGAAQRRPLPVDAGRALAAIAPGGRFWVRALDRDGGVLATLGSPEAPLDGPEVLTSDRPAAVVLAPVPAPPVEVAPARAPAPSASARRWVGGTLAIAGLVAAAVGVGLLVAGVGDVRRADDYPFNGLSVFESEALATSGQTLELGGGITGGAGLAALVAGLWLWLAKEPAGGAPHR